MGARFLINNQRGSILNIALLILMTLTLVVIYMSRSTTTDVKIAANEKAERVRFYSADGGGDIGIEIFEQNVACPTGFAGSATTGAIIQGKFIVKTLDIRANIEKATGFVISDSSTRDVYWPPGSAYGDQGSTSLAFGGETFHGQGASLQMSAGYEGKGKSAASGGAHLLFDIWSQYYGLNSANAQIWLRWKHLIGQEDDCIY